MPNPPNAGGKNWIPFPNSYNYPAQFYHEFPGTAGVSGASKANLITQVRYPTAKVLFVCFANGVPGGYHKKDAIAAGFVDGHAQLLFKGEITTRFGDLLGVPGPPYGDYSHTSWGNMDWTPGGIRGKDIGPQIKSGTYTF